MIANVQNSTTQMHAVNQHNSNSQDDQFVSGVFNPSEAHDIVKNVIDRQINFYKLQYLARWEGNHLLTMDNRDRKIAELERQKKELLAIIAEARNTKESLNLIGQLKVEISK